MQQKINSQLEIIESIGWGSTSDVYKCIYKNKDFEKVVAVKVIKQHFATDEVEFDFLNEARNVAKLQHPNIAQVIDIGHDNENRPIIIYEYLEGKTLKKIISEIPQRKLSELESLKIYTEIIKGLQFAHSKGIIHHDVKPANIIVTKHNQVKIIDFGLSKQSEDDKSIHGNISGTLAYYDPYLVQKKIPYDYDADLFSASLILFELLTGHKLFSSRLFSETFNDLLTFKSIEPIELEDIKSQMAKEICLMTLVVDRKNRNYTDIEKILLETNSFSDITQKNMSRRPKKKKNGKKFVYLASLISLALIIALALYFQKHSKQPVQNAFLLTSNIDHKNKLYIIEKYNSFTNTDTFSTESCNYIFTNLNTSTRLINQGQFKEAIKKGNTENEDDWKSQIIYSFQKGITFLKAHTHKCISKPHRALSQKLLDINELFTKLFPVNTNYLNSDMSRAYNVLASNDDFQNLVKELEVYEGNDIYIQHNNFYKLLNDKKKYIEVAPILRTDLYLLSHQEENEQFCSLLSEILYIHKYIVNGHPKGKGYKLNLIGVPASVHKIHFQIKGLKKHIPLFEVSSTSIAELSNWCFASIKDGVKIVYYTRPMSYKNQ